MRFLAGFFIDGVTLYGKSLADKRKIEIVIQGRGCPDGSGFDATVCRGEWFAIIRDAAIFKEQTNRFGDRRLIVFGGKHIMREAFFDQIVGQFALCQQGIAGNCFSVDIERIEDRDEIPISLVCLSVSRPSTGKAATFFGCGRGRIHGRRRP